MGEKVNFCLSKQIKEIVRKARGKGDVSGLIENLKNDLESLLYRLSDDKDLRVFDYKEGGVLRGPIYSRTKLEHPKDKNGLEKLLLCDDKQNNEVLFMRALFNSRTLSKYRLLAYETPFMRKKPKALNSDISNRVVSCDLLGISDGELCSIEIKTNPESDSTWLPYALTEAFAYGVCLSWLVKECGDDLRKELNLCRKSFLEFQEQLELPKIVSFAVAAPHLTYFKEYKLGVSNNRNGHSKEWFNRRVKETDVIENAIKNYFSKTLEFAGYLSIQDISEVDVIKGKSEENGKIKPTLTKFKNQVKTYSSIDKLLKDI